MNEDFRSYKGNLSEEEINKIAQEIFGIADQSGLSWDLEPQQNADGYYEILLSDEDGNADDYWSFETEETADKVIDKLGVIMEENNK